MTKNIYMLGLIAMSYMISACSGFLESKQPAERIYWLDPLIVQKEDSGDIVKSNIAVTVSAVPGLDTNRLLFLNSDAYLNHYASARWPDNIVELLESLLSTTLESTGRYSQVSQSATSRSVDLQLKLELRQFYVLENTANKSQEVHLLIKGNLYCNTYLREITMHTVIGIQDYRLARIVAAYQKALGNASRQLVRQTAGQCSITNQLKI